jgi:hypothetical protein
MWRAGFLSGLGFCFFMFCSSSLLVSEEILPIGAGYVCISDQDGTYLGGSDDGGQDYYHVSFRRAFKFIRRKKQTLNRKIRRASRQANTSIIVKLQSELQYWNDISNKLTQCQAGTLSVVEENSGGSNSPGLAVSTDPCTLIGAPMSDVSVSIINGNSCASQMPTPVVYIEIVDSRGEISSCTGTLVSSTGIITAAHCFAGGQVARITVASGTKQVQAASHYVHPNWSANQSAVENNDVAVIVLNEALGVSSLPILPANDVVTVGEQVLIAGYGLTEILIDQGLRAGYMTVSAVTEDLIEARYDGVTGSNSCNGDSGGPLLVLRGSQWYLAGDTSNGDAANCGVTEGTDISRWANLNAPSNRTFIAQYLGL